MATSMHGGSNWVSGEVERNSAHKPLELQSLKGQDSLAGEIDAFNARLAALELEVTSGGQVAPKRSGGSFCDLRSGPSDRRSAQGWAEAEAQRPAVPGSGHPAGAARR